MFQGLSLERFLFSVLPRLLRRSNLHSADTSDAGELRTAERLMERALQLQRHPRMLEILHELQARLKAVEAGGGEL